MLFIGITTRDNTCFAVDADGSFIGKFILGAAHQDLNDFAEWLANHRDGHHEVYATIACHDSTSESCRRLGLWQGALDILSVVHNSIDIADDSSAEVVAWKCKWKFEKDQPSLMSDGVYWSDDWGMVFVENDSAWFAKVGSKCTLELAVANVEDMQIVPILQKIGAHTADNDYPETDVTQTG